MPQGPITPIQTVSLILFLVADVMLAVVAWQHPRGRAYVVPFFLYSLHNSIFYTAILYCTLSGHPIFPNIFIDATVENPFTVWSQVIRAQAAFTLAGSSVVVVIEKALASKRRGSA